MVFSISDRDRYLTGKYNPTIQEVLRAREKDSILKHAPTIKPAKHNNTTDLSDLVESIPPVIKYGLFGLFVLGSLIIKPIVGVALLLGSCGYALYKFFSK